MASKLVTRPELTGLLEVGVIRFGQGTEVPSPNVAQPEGGVTGECLRLELRDFVTEVMKLRVLRVVERRRSGERRGVALRGRSVWLSPPKWLSRSGGLTEGCLAVAFHRGGVIARDTQRENDNTFHGVRFPSAKAIQVIVVSAYLTDTVRPQGFSPSRRFDPT